MKNQIHSEIKDLIRNRSRFLCIGLRYGKQTIINELKKELQMENEFLKKFYGKKIRHKDWPDNWWIIVTKVVDGLIEGKDINGWLVKLKLINIEDWGLFNNLSEGELLERKYALAKTLIKDLLPLCQGYRNKCDTLDCSGCNIFRFANNKEDELDTHVSRCVYGNN